MTFDAEVIGERITAIGKEKGITQKKLAEDLDVSASLINQYEKGGGDRMSTYLVGTNILIIWSTYLVCSKLSKIIKELEKRR